MDKAILQIRRARWIEVIRACQERPAGQTAGAWLDENGIKRKTYYTWLRRLRLEAAAEMERKNLPQTTPTTPVTFVEVPAAPAAVPSEEISAPETVSGFRPDAVIYIGGSAVAVTNSASTALLERIVEVMNHAR